MLPFFAQLPEANSSAAVGWLLVALTALGASVLMFRKIFGHEPPLHKEYVTKADHDAFRTETNNELKRHAARRAEIYDEQKNQGEKLARVEGALSAQVESIGDLKSQLHELENRVDEVPQRTISLLLDAQKISGKK